MADNTDETGSPDVDPTVRRAHRLFKVCQDRESTARARWIDDYKFANGDAYNNWQWPTDILRGRGARPSLTVNEVRQHNLHIINEAKQHKTDVHYRPTGGGATAESAQVYEGIYRHIANISNAQMAQGQAIEYQVLAGLGFTLIESDYTGPDTFEQEIYIRRVADVMGCYLIDSTEPDGSDARGALLFSDRPRDAVEAEFPQFKGRKVARNAVDPGGQTDWVNDDTIRDCRFYDLIEDKDELIADAEGTTILRSKLTPVLLREWEETTKAAGETLRRRPVVRRKVKCYRIVGDEVVDETDIPGTSIPVIPWVGETTVVDGEIDRKGHTRALIGPQQMTNYNWSGSVENGALQAKSPWVAPALAIQGYETYWRTANTENHSILPYNHVTDEGKEIPPPQRVQPSGTPPIFLEGVQLARQFMMSASGQYEAEMGQPGNEKSGRAINERQRQSDRATYHFTDNQALAIRRQGQIILEWIPVIYDTNRVLRIIGEDGTEDQVQLDVSAQEAHSLRDAAMAIFNPNVGNYEVVSDVGPDYATQRQEAFDAIVQVVTQAPQLMERIGDLLFRAADFPFADQIAERLKPGLAPEAQAAVSQLQAQLQKQNTLLGQTMQALTEERLKVRAKDSDRTIDAYDADTKRLAVVKDMLPLDPGEMQRLIHETVRQALQDNLGPIVGHLTQATIQDVSPAGPPGATGELPVRVPDVGREMATPGGM